MLLAASCPLGGNDKSKEIGIWKPVWQFLKKLKIELAYDPAIPLLGINSKEMKTRY